MIQYILLKVEVKTAGKSETTCDQRSTDKFHFM